jgi:hypothetical protein
MTPDESLRAVVQQIAGHNAWHAWVLEYGITHHRMVLALHLGGYPKTAKVELLDCTHLSGALQGGPYHLTVVEVDYHGEMLWEIRSVDASFRVVFGTARLMRELPS